MTNTQRSLFPTIMEVESVARRDAGKLLTHARNVDDKCTGNTALYTTTLLVDIAAGVQLGRELQRYKEACEFISRTRASSFNELLKKLEKTPMAAEFKPITDELKEIQNKFKKHHNGSERLSHETLKNLNERYGTLRADLQTKVTSEHFVIAQDSPLMQTLEEARNPNNFTPNTRHAKKAFAEKFVKALMEDTSPAAQAARTELAELQRVNSAQAAARGVKYELSAAYRQDVARVAKRMLVQADCAQYAETMRQCEAILEHDGNIATRNLLQSHPELTARANILKRSSEAINRRFTEIEGKIRTAPAKVAGRAEAAFAKVKNAFREIKQAGKGNFILAATAATLTLTSISGIVFDQQSSDEIDELTTMAFSNVTIDESKHKFSFEEQKRLIDWGIEYTQIPEEKELLTKLRDKYNYNYGKYLEAEENIFDGENNLQTPVSKEVLQNQKDAVYTAANARFFSILADTYTRLNPVNTNNIDVLTQEDEEEENNTVTATPAPSATETPIPTPQEIKPTETTGGETMTTQNGTLIFPNVPKIEAGLVRDSSKILELAEQIGQQEEEISKWTDGALIVAGIASAAKAGYDLRKYVKARQYFAKTLTTAYIDAAVQLKNTPLYETFKPQVDTIERLDNEIKTLEAAEEAKTISAEQQNRLKAARKELTKACTEFGKTYNVTEVAIKNAAITDAAAQLKVTPTGSEATQARAKFVEALKADTTKATEAARQELQAIEERGLNNVNKAKEINKLAEKVRAQQISAGHHTTIHQYHEIVRLDGKTEAAKMLKTPEATEAAKILSGGTKASIEARFAQLETRLAEEARKPTANSRAIRIARKAYDSGRNALRSLKTVSGANVALGLAVATYAISNINGDTFDEKKLEAIEKLTTLMNQEAQITEEMSKDPVVTNPAKRKELIAWAKDNTKNAAEKEFLTDLYHNYDGDYGKYLKAKGIILKNEALQNMQAAPEWVAASGDVLTNNANILFYTYVKSIEEQRQQKEGGRTTEVTPVPGSEVTPAPEVTPNPNEVTPAPEVTPNPNEVTPAPEVTPNPNEVTPAPETEVTPAVTADGKLLFPKVPKIEAQAIRDSSKILELAEQIGQQEEEIRKWTNGALWVAGIASAAKVGYDVRKYVKARQYFSKTLTTAYIDAAVQLKNTPLYETFKPQVDTIERLNNEIKTLEAAKEAKTISAEQQNRLKVARKELTKACTEFGKTYNVTEVAIKNAAITDAAAQLKVTPTGSEATQARAKFIEALKADTTEATKAARQELQAIEERGLNNVNKAKEINKLAEKVRAQQISAEHHTTIRQYNEIVRLDGKTEAAKMLKTPEAKEAAKILSSGTKASIEARFAQLETKLAEEARKAPNSRVARIARNALDKGKSAFKSLKTVSGANVALGLAVATYAISNMNGETFDEKKLEAIEKLTNLMNQEAQITEEQQAKNEALKDPAKRKELIEWGIVNTKNASEKEFLTKLRDNYNCDYGAYLKGEGIILKDDALQNMQAAPVWVEASGEVVIDNTNALFFSHLEEVRAENEREMTQGPTPEHTDGVDGNNGNTDENNGNTDENNGNADGTDENNGNTDENNGNTSGNDETAENDDTEGTDDTDDTDPDENEGTDDKSHSTSPTPAPTPRVADTSSTPSHDVTSTDEASASSDSSSTSTTSTPTNQVTEQTPTPNGQNPTPNGQIQTPSVQPQLPVMPQNAPVTNGSEMIPTELSEEEKKKLGAMQAEGEKEEEESWWSRNMSWILTALAVLASLGIAWFFINKYKKESKTTTAETESLQTQVSNLQNQLKDSSNTASTNSQETTASVSTSESTLAKSSTAVKDQTSTSATAALKNNSNSIG